MTALVALVLGAAVGLAVVLVVCGATGRPVLPPIGAASPGSTWRWWPALLAVGFGGGALVVTGWPAAGLLAGAAALTVPRAAAGARRYRAEITIVEAIASWTEMLRDTMAAASGLEQAIVASAPIAPAPIEAAVGRLASRLDYERLADALRAFADDVDHPTADFVVAGLVTAAEHQARQLGPLLTQLAASARDEAQMRARVWAGRARTRTSVRVISGSIGLFAVGLLVLDRSYLTPYDTVGGQLMLVAIGGLFAGSVLAMDRMGRVALPERFVRRRAEVSPR